MNRIKINLWQDFRYLKGSPYNITYPHNFPEIRLKETEGKLDSNFEVTARCGPTYNYRL